MELRKYILAVGFDAADKEQLEDFFAGSHWMLLQAEFAKTQSRPAGIILCLDQRDDQLSMDALDLGVEVLLRPLDPGNTLRTIAAALVIEKTKISIWKRQR